MKKRFEDEFEDASGAEGEEGGAKSDEFARMLEESFGKKSRRLSVGDKIRGEILVAGREEVFVSLGGSSEGIVPRRDLLDESGQFPYQVGSVLDLYVTLVKGSEVYLSPNPTAKNAADDLEDAFDMMLPVEGRVVEAVKGGVRVSLMGKTAFCPISQLDLKFVETPEEYVGKKFDFRITQFSEGGKNIVVSRKRILEEEREQAGASLMEDHQVGDQVRGRVTRLEKFGAFVELSPGIEGLLHISEISWSRIGDPSEVVQVGQELPLKILKMELDEKGRPRISLSLKQAEGERPDPFAQAGVKDQFKVGSTVSGTVERREPYGLFIRIAPGMTGLLHRSKAMENPEFPFEKLKPGEETMVQIIEIRPADRRISLGVPRDPANEDWKNYMAEEKASSGGSSFGTLGDQLKAALGKKDRKS